MQLLSQQLVKTPLKWSLGRQMYGTAYHDMGTAQPTMKIQYVHVADHVF